MSCYNSNCYLPQPPRAWSRVQNSCSLNTDDENTGLVKVPYTNTFIPAAALGDKMAMLNKGNVLQYKANSSNLTKSQRYSKIAKGQWVNRNTTWATQSTRGYTNPNTTSLKRSGNVVNIAIDPITGAIIGPTVAPPTCPQNVVPINEVLPSNGGGGSDENDPNIPPPVEPTPGSDTFPTIIPDEPVEPIVIQDEGVLICSIQENICTGETKRSLSQQLCNPTSDSDVPGQIQQLCWNDGTPTWYPRQRYVMSNSTNKWPVNAKLVSAIYIIPPVITSVTYNYNFNGYINILKWIQDKNCLQISNYNIYQNGELIKSVSGNIFSTEIEVSNCNTYDYYIIGENVTAKSVSDKSNTVSIDMYLPEKPINLSQGDIILTSIITRVSGEATIELIWKGLEDDCSIFKTYQIFMSNNGGISYNNIGSSVTTSFTTSPQEINKLYIFYVTSENIDLIQSPPSNLLNVFLPVIYTTTGTITEKVSSNYVTLKYLSNGYFNFNYNLLMSFTLVSGGGAGAKGYLNVPTAAGGGGEVLNSNGHWIVNSDTWSITIGIGQLAYNESIPPSLSAINDSSIVASNYNITDNKTILTNSANNAGQGGDDEINYSDYGGGGNGATGGTYNTFVTASSGGGAGGNLVTISQNGIYNIIVSGNPGINATTTNGGNGGDGRTGVDLIVYGGGGGGSLDGGDVSKIGSGGSGGGGDGGYISSGTQISGTSGSPNSGGGGGGTCKYNNLSTTITAGDGGSGIVILYFTVPS